MWQIKKNNIFCMIYVVMDFTAEHKLVSETNEREKDESFPIFLFRPHIFLLIFSREFLFVLQAWRVFMQCRAIFSWVT